MTDLQKTDLVYGKPGSDCVDATGKRVAVLLPIAGISSEVWVSRQARAFRKLDPTLIAWENAPARAWEFPGKTVLTGSPWSSKKSGGATGVFRKIRAFSGASDPADLKAIRRAFDKVNPDVVLCHFGWTAVRALPVFKQRQLPFVVIFHGRDVPLGRIRGSYKRKLRQVVEHAAALVIVGSHMESILEDVATGFDRARLHRIPCGAPIKSFASQPMPERMTGEVLKLVVVCRLAEEKGIDLVLRALSQAGDELGHVSLTVVGDGPFRGDLEGLSASLGLAGRVMFLGNRHPDDVAKLLSQHHVFIQPSRTGASGWIEGFGVSITESMAAGVPIIASRMGGIPDQVRDGLDGLLVEEGDVPGLVDGIRRFDTDEAFRSKAGASARLRAMEFDSDRMALKLEEVLLASVE